MADKTRPHPQSTSEMTHPEVPRQPQGTVKRVGGGPNPGNLHPLHKTSWTHSPTH